MGRLEGKVAIVTGANSGIGKATALRFAAEGASLVLAARRLEPLEQVAGQCRELGARAYAVSADVSVEADCDRIFDCVRKDFDNKLDILVNNAGVVDKHRPITSCDPSWYEHIIAIDQDSMYLMSKRAIELMEPRGYGVIVNVSSMCGVFGNGGIAYSTAKAAVIGMTKAIAMQFAETEIRCNAICPGPTPTALIDEAALEDFDPYVEQTGKHLNLDCPSCTVEDQAAVICFLASDEARCVTGQALVVDHGCSL